MVPGKKHHVRLESVCGHVESGFSLCMGELRSSLVCSIHVSQPLYRSDDMLRYPTGMLMLRAVAMMIILYGSLCLTPPRQKRLTMA